MEIRLCGKDQIFEIKRSLKETEIKIDRLNKGRLMVMKEVSKKQK